METIDYRSFKQKVIDAKNKVCDGTKKTVHWCIENPGKTMAIVGGITAALAETRRVYDRVNDKIEDRARRTSVYCNDVQGRVKLKHELNANENRKLRELMNHGYTRFEALDEMGLLK